MSGYPVTLRDTRDYYDHDIALIVIVTIVVVLLILVVLLRAVVAPLYLVGSVSCPTCRRSASACCSSR